MSYDTLSLTRLQALTSTAKYHRATSCVALVGLVMRQRAGPSLPRGQACSHRRDV